MPQLLSVLGPHLRTPKPGFNPGFGFLRCGLSGWAQTWQRGAWTGAVNKLCLGNASAVVNTGAGHRLDRWGPGLGQLINYVVIGDASAVVNTGTGHRLDRGRPGLGQLINYVVIGDASAVVNTGAGHRLDRGGTGLGQSLHLYLWQVSDGVCNK
jgi:hypothetical protein